MQQYDRYPFLSSYCQFLVASAVYLYCHVLCQAGLPADRSNASAILPGLPSGYFSCSFRITVTGSHRTLTCFPFHRTKRPTPHTFKSRLRDLRAACGCRQASPLAAHACASSRSAISGWELAPTPIYTISHFFKNGPYNRKTDVQIWTSDDICTPVSQQQLSFFCFKLCQRHTQCRLRNKEVFCSLCQITALSNRSEIP